VFLGDQLIGYTCTKCHILDVGQKDPVILLDSVDLFQEGLIVPGVKLYRAGVLNSDLYRTILANSRLPEPIAGDIGSMIGAIRIGAQALERLVERYGVERFHASLELVFDHAETVMREFISSIPDGRYVGVGLFEGRPADEPIPIELAIAITNSDMAVDLTTAPDQLPFPENLPVPNVISVIRGWLLSLLGGAETINEGHFRALQVRTRPGSMFQPLPPAPVSSYIFGVSGLEGFLRALSDALPHLIPAQMGGDTDNVAFFGRSDDGTFWASTAILFGGQGALPDRDGTCPLPFIPWSGMRINSSEIVETRTPVLVEDVKFGPTPRASGSFADFPATGFAFVRCGPWPPPTCWTARRPGPTGCTAAGAGR